MGFLSFIVLLAIAYLVWRVTDQLPDLIFRLSEIQRDVAEIRRRLVEQNPPADVTRPSSGTATAPGTNTPATAGPAPTPGTASPGSSAPGAGSEGSATPGGASGGAVHGGETGADYTRS